MRPIQKLNLITLALLATTQVQASGFALIEQSASGQGLSYAGAAANTENASIMWFNPAGLTDIKGTQAIIGAHAIIPQAPFTNNGSSTTYPNGTTVPISGPNDDGTNVGFVPNIYWTSQYGENHFGLGINVPFGQRITYQENWVGRYNATETDLKTYNINPSFARKINNHFSFGVGLNAQYVNVILQQKINQSALHDTDGNAKLTGNSWAFGYNLGLMYKFKNKVNIGLGYRSGMSHYVKGKVQYQHIKVALSSANAQANVNLPASATLAMDYQFNPKMQILASTTWTGWSAYDELVVKYDNGSPDSHSHQNFRDSWRFALGTIYQLNNAWKLRTGIAVDKTPVPNAESRSPRTPDTDRNWISIGAGYKINPKMNLDVGYSHLFGGTEGSNYTSKSSLGNNTLKGKYSPSVDILSAQLVWKY